MSGLVELVQEERALLELLETLEFEDDDTEAAIQERMDEVLEMARAKTDRLVAFLRFVDARREELKALQKEMLQRARSLTRLQEGMKDYLCSAHQMEYLPDKVEGEKYGLRFQRNSKPTVRGEVESGVLEEWYEYPITVGTDM